MMAAFCQGIGKAPPGQQQGMRKTPKIVTVGAPPVPEDEGERLRARILDVARSGVPRHSWDPERGWCHKGEWLVRLGGWPWWEMRQRVGGRVPEAAFRAAVDELLARGQLLEVWLKPRGRRTPDHILLVPGGGAELPRPVAQARGRSDVLAREPWAGRLV